MSLETLNRVKTDAHLDTNEVRPGAILICPVKIDGGGVYIGDCHANQGDGEPGLHTTDITAEARVRVNVIKNLPLDGPILLPVAEDVPFIARPFSQEELAAGERLAQRYHVKVQRNVGPVQFIGTGPYAFKERKPDQYVQLVRFDGYSARSEPASGSGGHAATKASRV